MKLPPDSHKTLFINRVDHFNKCQFKYEVSYVPSGLTEKLEADVLEAQCKEKADMQYFNDENN